MRLSSLSPIAVVVVFAAFFAASCQKEPEPTKRVEYAGSKSCRDCHAEFYERWSTSRHGLAMQTYSAEFAKTNLTPQDEALTIDGKKYRAEIKSDAGYVIEREASGDKKLPIAHLMGGKNVFYFLTPSERGRLQTLPVAYDVKNKKWYDATAAGVRHFVDRQDAALAWTDRAFTFNASCFNCHVSQLRTNYDQKSDSYATTWREPGINCESCHGPAEEHRTAMSAAVDPTKVADAKIISTKHFSAGQMNDMCATCHAKLVPLSLDFRPGDKFFDHFDLIALENPDYYPDGRDLGENYTFTSWQMSPCAKSGRLDCNYCHTSSGRMRFSANEINKSCWPCHEKNVQDAAVHSHHKAGEKAPTCVSCHMPKTQFGRMERSNHSMLPPTPAMTTAFRSPNACNACHTDKDAAWTDAEVRKWHADDYQAEPLRRAALIVEARRHDWKRLPEMLAEITKKDGDAIYQASLIRLIRECGDDRKWPALTSALKDASPLVRSSAATALGDRRSPETLAALLTATTDESRLVRIRAASALASAPIDRLGSENDKKNLRKATKEFLAAAKARPDDWTSYAALGNYYLERQELTKAVEQFQIASKLEPRQIGPRVNAATALNVLGQADKAETCLREALKSAPDDAAVNFNLGLLLGEQGRTNEAEQALRKAVKADPKMADAAFNLGVIVSEKNLGEGISWCKKAHELRPGDVKFAYTLAYFERRGGNAPAAVKLLEDATKAEPKYFDAFILLAEIYEERKEFASAASAYQAALKIERLPQEIREELEMRVKSAELRNREPGPRN